MNHRFIDFPLANYLVSSTTKISLIHSYTDWNEERKDMPLYAEAFEEFKRKFETQNRHNSAELFMLRYNLTVKKKNHSSITHHTYDEFNKIFQHNTNFIFNTVLTI